MEPGIKPDNVIFVGTKPLMNYVLATITQSNSVSNEVIIKARGRAISRAVDVAEITRRRYMPGLLINNIKITTEEVTNETGDMVNVSSIEIYLKK